MGWSEVRFLWVGDEGGHWALRSHCGHPSAQQGAFSLAWQILGRRVWEGDDGGQGTEGGGRQKTRML